MIHEVDETLQGLLTDEVLGGTGVEVVFEAPTKEWAARRNAPTINLFLYDIRESVPHRQQGRVPEYGPDGSTVAHHGPPRWFLLSYLVTAWTKRPQDEHRLLSVLLAGLAGRTALPGDRLTGSLAALGLAVPCTIALPPGEGRALADVWSALGGELKPSLDLVITAPLAAARQSAAPPVTDALLLRTVDRAAAAGPEGTPQRDEVRRPRYGDGPEDGTPGAGADGGGAAGAPGAEDGAPGRAAVPVGVRRARGEAARRVPRGPVRR
ncbi:DUF4255 domain-containing protein [Streptomyces sp. TRM 70351]|uniref:DUF4255 domain-containing protein n=1 Tax=Streptomyces sp. TRM 70351 TaxID=3116552 RepID=UPI002E7BE161|nr:DUF4255 domain-containing protein [Streptomyces sp. TRM 70351]MEE1927554.1 DUF4255 domain-containing protein [Streptomyces sp. TRM 70351]